MQTADTPRVEEAIQRALASESATTLIIDVFDADRPPLTVTDARRIIECLREKPRINTLSIYRYDIHNAAMLNIFRDGLPLCTTVTTVSLSSLGSDGLEILLPAFYNTSVTKLGIHGIITSATRIQGQHVGEVLRDLLVGNYTLLALNLCRNTFGAEGARGLGKGLAVNSQLQILYLYDCHIGNDGLANLLLSMGEANNNSLMGLNLSSNDIQGADGGRQVSLLLQRFPTLTVLDLCGNNLGPLGARALAPGLAAATSQLERLDLECCGLGNDGVANLVPDGQENTSLTNLDLGENEIQGAEGGRHVSLLLRRFPQLKVLCLDNNPLLGPLGARALAPGLAAASQLEGLQLHTCGLGNDGVSNLVPDGKVNMTLTDLSIRHNGIEGAEGGENILALVSRCTNLDSIHVAENALSLDQKRRLNLLLD